MTAKKKSAKKGPTKGTSYRLDETTLALIKALAAEKGSSVTQVIRDLVRERASKLGWKASSARAEAQGNAEFEARCAAALCRVDEAMKGVGVE